MVRIHHLPLPAETARELGFLRSHGPSRVVSSRVIVGQETSLHHDGYGQIADGIGAGGAVHRTASSLACDGSSGPGYELVALRRVAHARLGSRADAKERMRGSGPAFASCCRRPTGPVRADLPSPSRRAAMLRSVNAAASGGILQFLPAWRS